MTGTLERYLFLENRRFAFSLIGLLSLCTALILIGPQILYANWSLIDNWDYFNWLGPDLNLPFSEVWHTLMTKTEVGSFAGRFRPCYYMLMVLEASLWGPNVHLWYLARTLEFGVFIASVWWIVSRFAGLWLAAVLLIPILAGPFWGDVWARLGPQEIYGCAAVGIILFGAYGLFAMSSRGVRIAAGFIVTLATIVLIGTKETFLPIAGLSVVFLFAAAARRLVPGVLSALLIAVICACGAFEFYIVQKIVMATGTDFNGDAIGLPLLKELAVESLFQAIRLWLPVHLVVAFAFASITRWRAADWRQWKNASLVASLAFTFLVCLYVSQCIAYRSVVALNMRYDFPKMLFNPFNYCLLSCYAVYMTRAYFTPHAANYLSLGAAVVLAFVFIPNISFKTSVSRAVVHNIDVTTRFYNELQLIIAAAKHSPNVPIILEAHEPLTWAYEPVFSLSTYLTVFGTHNSIAVRVHPKSNPTERMAAGFKTGLMAMQDVGNDRFVSLAVAAKLSQRGCISVGINGPASSDCTGFEVKTE
ncbi:hypothetical protein [Bradyrhizobium sp. RT3b]|uniref:hypothetical protein n=1 Tax=Bradyrhizobium sp. RT3b TaxID=3156334 RepID=UPI0033940BB3